MITDWFELFPPSCFCLFYSYCLYCFIPTHYILWTDCILLLLHRTFPYTCLEIKCSKSILFNKVQTGSLFFLRKYHDLQFSSVAQSCPTLCNPKNHSTPGLPGHHQLPEFTQTHVHQVGDAIQPSHPLSSPSPPAPIPPRIRVFSNESTLCMRWPKYRSFSFRISPSNEHPRI